MTTTIAVANQKGGVGKTTTVVNIAAYAALAGKQVLVVDIDPQGNASSVLAPDYEGPCVFGGGEPRQTDTKGLHIIPRGDDLAHYEAQLAERPTAAGLRGKLSEYLSRYDLILIDCPPSLAILPANALMAADKLLIPIQCEYYAMEGLGQITSFIMELAEHSGHEVELAGIAMTMYNDGQDLDRAVVKEVREHFPGAVFKTQIPRDVALAAAPSHGRSILAHDPLSPGGVAYLALTKELLDGIE